MPAPDLPDHDDDLRLARRIGSDLERGGLPAPEAASDAFYRALLAARPADESKGEAASERLWAGLEARMGAGAPAPQPAHRATRRAIVFPLRPFIGRLAVAASLLLAVVMAWYLFRAQPGERLLLRAESAIANHVASDGSVVLLRPHSALYLTAESRAETRYRLEGEGFFDVREQVDRRFVVEAGLSVVSVLGTRFNVSTWGERTDVYLQEGRVQLTLQGSDRSVILNPGQRAVVDTGTPGIETAAADEAVYLDWLSNEISFRSQPARAVADELEQHFGLRIRLPAAVDTVSVTGTLYTESGPDQPLTLFGSQLGGRFEAVDGTTYRFVSATP